MLPTSGAVAIVGKDDHMSKRTCSYPTCDMPHDSKGYCTNHNHRIRLYGDPHGKRCETCKRPLQEVFKTVRTQSYCGAECRPSCSFEGCAKPLRKMTLCEIHYNQTRRTGTLRPLNHSWAATGLPCHNCGERVPETSRKRKYCTPACEQLHRRYGNSRPTVKNCGSCGEVFDLTARKGKTASLRRVDAKLCESCRAKKRKYGMNVFELALRDGTNCHICSEPVDMSLSRAESVFCPSIDHLTPRALGGTDDPENLALAHFWCNAVKSDREGFTIA